MFIVLPQILELSLNYYYCKTLSNLKQDDRTRFADLSLHFFNGLIAFLSYSATSIVQYPA